MDNIISNKNIADYMFNKIKEFGFKPYNITHPDGYFLMEGESYSVVHFNLKGVWRNWKFGMWIHSNHLDENYRKEHSKDYSEEYDFPIIEIFCQHMHTIDKFKPSASQLYVKYTYKDWEDKDKYTYPFYNLKNMLRMIKRHPFICYEGYCGRHVGYTSESFIWNYIKYEYGYYHLKNVKRFLYKCFWFPYTKIKILLSKRDKCIKKIELHNFEKENPGWTKSSIYDLNIYFDDESTEQEQIKWVNKWFKKDKYGEYYKWDYIIEVNYFYKKSRIGFC